MEGKSFTKFLDLHTPHVDLDAIATKDSGLNSARKSSFLRARLLLPKGATLPLWKCASRVKRKRKVRAPNHHLCLFLHLQPPKQKPQTPNETESGARKRKGPKTQRRWCSFASGVQLGVPHGEVLHARCSAHTEWPLSTASLTARATSCLRETAWSRRGAVPGDTTTANCCQSPGTPG